MNFNDFQIKYSETIMYYQIIESDLKLIYAYMSKGDPNDNFSEIKNKALGNIINELMKLDYSDTNNLLTHNDYNYLKKISKNRNHWAHETFIEFMYLDNILNSKEYLSECKKLIKDHDIAETVYKRLEKIRLDYCKMMKR